MTTGRGRGKSARGANDPYDLDRFGNGVNSPGNNSRGAGAPATGRAKEVHPEGGFQNFYTVYRPEKKPLRVGYALQEIEERLKDLAEGWPKRIDNLLFAEGPGPRPLWLETPAQLFAWMSRLLPRSDDRRNRLVWGSGPDMVSEARLFAALAYGAEAVTAVEPCPHWPEIPGHHYMHPKVEGGDGKALGALLARFSPATPIDADLLRAFFLSLLWGGPPGARPAWLFTSDADDDQGGRGVGKSTVVKMASRLVGGHIDLAANEKMPDVITRLLSPDALQRRVVLLDNVKSLKFSWAELEALITDDTVSGHRLYHGDGRRPNTLTFCITLNGASLSRDLAQRCVVVKLARPTYNGTWEQDTIDLIDRRRWHIIGDALAALEGDGAQLAQHGRWGTWEKAVLSRVDAPADCQQLIEDRQAEADDDTTEADLVREVFAKHLCNLGHDPENDVVWVPTRIAGQWCNEALGEKRPIQKASTYLQTLSVPQLRRSKRDDFGGRGWEWRGGKAPPDKGAVKLNDPAPPVGAMG